MTVMQVGHVMVCMDQFIMLMRVRVRTILPIVVDVLVMPVIVGV